MMRTAPLIAALFLLGTAGSAAAQSAQNVLVVINESSPESRDIGEYYIQKRQIPPDNVVRVQLTASDEVDHATYQARIEAPISSWLISRTAWDRILYIVLTKGVPLRVSGTNGQTGTVASVDSELTLLYRKMTGSGIVLNGPIKNPYYSSEGIPKDGVKPFTHELYDIFLVTRLDGFTVAQAKALVDRGLAPSRDGQIVLDGRVEIGTPTPGNTWLERTASALSRISGWRDRVTVDTGGKRAGRGTNLLGYYSWGSNDIVVQAAGAPDLSFVPGALAAMFVSTDARTFRQPPEGWRPGKTEFAGSNQSLTGDLVRQGVTGAAGHVAEPYLVAAIRPDVLFPAYVSGLNLAEAFYSAMPYLSWQTVVLGDPLCAPFRQKALDRSQIESPVDPISELPGFFTQHRVRSPARGAVRIDAWKMFIRAEYLGSRGDTANAREMFERATKTDDRLVAGHFALALMAQSRSDWDEAIARYRRVVALQPANFLALNDLGYLLAERKNAPGEALPLAARAYQLSKGVPVIADTLAWTQHLLGRNADAAPIIRQAARQLPGNAEVQWHAAVILAAVGDTAAATAALDLAVKANPPLADRGDVRALRSKLQSTPRSK